MGRTRIARMSVTVTISGSNMSDPNYMHEFWPNRKGTCQEMVTPGPRNCGLTEDAPVHQRYKDKYQYTATDEARMDWLISDIDNLLDVYERIKSEQEDVRTAIDQLRLMKGSE